MKTEKNRKKLTYKGPRPIRYFLTTMVVVSALLFIQLLLFFLLSFSVAVSADNSKYYGAALVVEYLISAAVMLSVINRKCNIAYKLAWAVPILLFPGFGALLYLIFRSSSIHRMAKIRIFANKELFERAKGPSVEEVFPKDHPFARIPAYLSSVGFSTYRNTDALYLSSGEEFHQKLLSELSKAREFIFMEFFIIHEGVMWNDILEILREKAKEGVCIRVLYDGMGSVKTLPGNYTNKLKEAGIDAKIFQPFVPVISSIQNNRDHRKIVVIDGKVGFTGGINLSDEYINVYDRFGHWKDAGILIKGEAVRELTCLFLEMWYTNHKADEHPERFLKLEPQPAEGWIIPYADSPLFETDYIKSVYLEMINGARNYIYITTPYLVPGDDILAALCRAAHAGVDVRLITPLHGDKRTVHMISRSYYRELLTAGVRIFEYTPGFIHSKNLICDDRVCSVGTANLDYRSLYLHYECGVLAVDMPAVQEVKEDFLSTERKCEEILLKDMKSPNALCRLFISLMRFIEPLI